MSQGESATLNILTAAATSSSITIAFVYERKSSDLSYYKSFLKMQSSSGTVQPFQIFQRTGIAELEFRWPTNNSYGFNFIRVPTPSVGERAFFALTIQSSGGTATGKVYKNGALLSTNAGLPSYYSSTNTGTIDLNNEPSASVLYTTDLIYGPMFFYTAALTDSEVLSLYHRTLPSAYSPAGKWFVESILDQNDTTIINYGTGPDGYVESYTDIYKCGNRLEEFLYIASCWIKPRSSKYL